MLISNGKVQMEESHLRMKISMMISMLVIQIYEYINEYFGKRSQISWKLVKLVWFYCETSEQVYLSHKVLWVVIQKETIKDKRNKK